jgi:hypothetical protein
MNEPPLEPWMTSSRGPFLTLNAGGPLSGIVTITALPENILGMAQNFIAGPLRHPGRCRRVATSCLLPCRGREYRGGP